MPDYYTNMSTLLTAIKNRLLAYQSTTLSSVKTYKRGVLPPLPSFPAIAVLPIRETLHSARSGGDYRADREINIEIYTKALGTANSLRDNMDIVDAVKDILKTEFQMDDSGKATYDAVMQTHILGEPQPFRNTLVQKCTIPVMCRSLESCATGGTFSTTITDNSAKSVLDEVYDAINAYSYTKNVKVKAKATLPPCMDYPSVHVLEDTDFPDRYEAGIDQPNRGFTVACFNRQLDKEALLDNLLIVVEDVKDCLQETPRWSNKARNSWVTGVEYGTYPLEKGALYGAFVTMMLWAWDTVA